MLLIWINYVVFGLLWTPLAISYEHIPTIVIEPNKLYCNEKLYNGNSVYYQLKNLQIDTAYELRISYPAVIPTEFIITDLNKTTAAGRKLLNVAKLIIWTESSEKERYVEVTALRVGIPVKPSLGEQPVIYDIIAVWVWCFGNHIKQKDVLDKLYGGLPFGVWKVVLIILATIFIVVKYCLQPTINWINDDIGKLE